MKTQLIPLRTSHSLSRAVLEYPFFRHAQDQVARLVQSARIRGAKLVELGLIKGALMRWAMRLKVARVQILSRDVFILTGRFFRDLKLCVRAHSGRIVVHRLGAPRFHFLARLSHHLSSKNRVSRSDCVNLPLLALHLLFMLPLAEMRGVPKQKIVLCVVAASKGTRRHSWAC